jgi:hypothetical protein
MVFLSGIQNAQVTFFYTCIAVGNQIIKIERNGTSIPFTGLNPGTFHVPVPSWMIDFLLHMLCVIPTV